MFKTYLYLGALAIALTVGALSWAATWSSAPADSVTEQTKPKCCMLSKPCCPNGMCCSKK